MNNQLRLELSRVNEVQLLYRSRSSMERPMVSNSASAWDLLRPWFDGCMEMHEEAWVILLDRGNRVKAVMQVSKGGVTGTVVDPKIVFAAALKTLACGLIMAHNHPSGQLRPSEEDIRLTRKLADGARLLDMHLQDHLIVTRTGYYSFADNGML